MQTAFHYPAQLPPDAYDYGNRSSGETHGVVLTKPHIVELILDLADYRPDTRDLGALNLLEPSCGEGAFLTAALRRLLASARKHGRPASSLGPCLRTFDIVPSHVDATRRALREVLAEWEVPERTRSELLDEWLAVGDFLLMPIDRHVDFCVGNPPYVRIEQLSPALQAEYRRRFSSLYDRADLYVAFIQRSLSLLGISGRLSFICADRWVLNKYGAPLRAIVSKSFRMHCYVDLHRASPFESDVVAYPSIFVMGPGKSTNVPVVTLDTGSPQECASVVDSIKTERSHHSPTPGVEVSVYRDWFKGDSPWIISSPAHLSALRELEEAFGPLEANARVGIGVATGLDRVYIVEADAGIEKDRLVPLAMRQDIERGEVRNAGRYVINAFHQSGRLVNLDEYPRLASYFDSHADDIRRRHVAKKNPRAWYRTIDRVYPELVNKPKLLIPDIAGSNEVAFDPGGFHPHHNLYFITSDVWDVEVLGGLLSSRVALFFVWSYALKMRGGYLRFQAQYLRRIRVPAPAAIDPQVAKDIKAAFRARDFARLDDLALGVYGIDSLPEFDFIDTRK